MENKYIIKVPFMRIEREGGCKDKVDEVICEERVALYLNGKKILSTMSIPEDQDAHAIGFLLSEAVIESVNDIKHIEIVDSGLRVNIEAKIKEENLKNLYHEKTLTTGCCVGITGNFEGKIIEKFVASQVRVRLEILWKILKSFYESNELFNQTGCVHKAVLMDKDGHKIDMAFDVGRHNAVDKVVGKALMAGKKLDFAILCVSGRLSLEMVIKSAMHDIPIVVSRSATTQLAIQAAQKLGITLIGFAREGRCNVYTHQSRIMVD